MKLNNIFLLFMLLTAAQQTQQSCFKKMINESQTHFLLNGPQVDPDDFEYNEEVEKDGHSATGLDNWEAHELYCRDLKLPLDPLTSTEATSINAVEIVDSNISNLTNLFKDVYNLKKLEIVNSSVEIIQPEALHELTDLWHLSLSQNNLKELRVDVYNNLVTLRFFDVSQNKIEKIQPNVFTELINLKRVNMSHNSLTIIDNSTLFSTRRMVYLDLSYNRIEHIEPNVLKDLHTKLMHFDISNNKLKKFDFGNLDKKASVMQSLDISHNKIGELGPNGKNLKYLSISHNNVTTLKPSNFKTATNLEVIDLSYNLISVIKFDTFRGLEKLIHLDLSFNNLTTIPLGLFNDGNSIRHLNLCNNQIETFQYGVFEGLEALEVLDICMNRLQDLHEEAFLPMRLLRMLDITGNKISHIFANDLLSINKQLMTIALDDNKWDCKNLLRIIMYLNRRGVEVKSGNSFRVQNAQGIACINNDNFSHVSNELLTSRVAQMGWGMDRNRGLNDQYDHFFNRDFRNSPFFKYLEDIGKAGLSAANHKDEGNYTAWDILLIVLVISLFAISLILSIGVYITYNSFKKRRSVSTSFEPMQEP